MIAFIFSLALASACERILAPDRARDLVALLRRVQRYSPSLDPRELARADISREAAEFGWSLTPAELEAVLRDGFGDRVAAFEFAGFETNAHLGSEWTKAEIKARFLILRKHGDVKLHAREYLLYWRAIDQHLGGPGSAFTLWLATRARYGSLNNLLRSMNNKTGEGAVSTHPSDSVRRLSLTPGSAETRFRHQANRLHQFAKSRLGKADPESVAALARYLRRYRELNDHTQVRWFLLKEVKRVPWLFDFDSILNELTRSPVDDEGSLRG